MIAVDAAVRRGSIRIVSITTRESDVHVQMMHLNGERAFHDRRCGFSGRPPRAWDTKPDKRIRRTFLRPGTDTQNVFLCR
jgi:hypothetical protein